MSAPAATRPARLPAHDARPDHARLLRRMTALYVVAVLAHGADHLRRGIESVTVQVRSAGGIQLLLALAVLVLALRWHRWAAPAAAALGFTSALLFVAVHFVPHWGVFSDAFTGDRVGPGVTTVSWVAAIVEVVAGLALGWVGARALAREWAA